MNKTVAILIAAWLISILGLARAEPSMTAKNQKLTQIQSQIEQVNQNIEQIKSQRKLLLAQLRDIEKQYGSKAGSLRNLRVQINNKQKRIEFIKGEIKKLQAELAVQNKELGKQVKASFVMGKKEKLKLILNQQNPVLASRMLVYYNYLNKNRIKKLSSIRNNLALLKKLEQEKQQDTLLLKRALESHHIEQLDLNKMHQQREQLLAKLNQEFNVKSLQLSQLKEDEKKLSRLTDVLEQAAVEQQKIDQLATEQAKTNPEQAAATRKIEVTTQLDADGNPVLVKVERENRVSFENLPHKAFTELKGQLPWPVLGTIARKFGSPRFETRWDGVLIAAKEGTEIHAITDGRVVFADWLRGYGLLMILDHGEGYMSLYAFNQSLYKKLGDQVSAGSVIAAVGSSDGREEPGLYFGLRNKGKPIDPALWCRK